ncbi:hypothetical protein ICN48_13700, partial [Polynucleobacter sp. JS-Safj-400b-B2]|uniref:hypothetical protein n=1 Tax=Polynucleobacter sp. JS-Safj-400b-B2 TaxID=2576921 RepID=UPI001C0DBAD4
MPATVQEATFNSGFAMAESMVGQMINGAPAFITKGNFLSTFALSYATSYSEISANNVNHYTAGQIQAAAITSATLDASVSGALVLAVGVGITAVGLGPVVLIAGSALVAGAAAGYTSSSTDYDAIKQSITNSIINGTQNFDKLLNSYNNVSAASLVSNAPINSSVTVTTIGSVEVIGVSQTNSSGQIIATASDTLSQNSATVDIKNYTGGSVQNEQVINGSNTGAITDTISGSGASIALSNATITLANGASATVDGNGNTLN